MEVSVSLSCLFVHEPPYQTTVVCCNPVFRRGSSRMDHRTFSTLEWGSLRLAPTTKTDIMMVRLHAFTYVELNLDSPWLYCSIKSFLQTHMHAHTDSHIHMSHTRIYTHSYPHSHTHTPTVGHYTIQVKAQVFTYGVKII